MKVPNKMDNVQSKEQGFYDSNRDLTEKKKKVKKQSHLFFFFFVRSISHQLKHKDLHASLLVVSGHPYLPGHMCFLGTDPKPSLADEICEGDIVCPPTPCPQSSKMLWFP